MQKDIRDTLTDALGFNIKGADRYDMSLISGRHAFTHYLRDVNVRGVRDLYNMADATPEVHKQPMKVQMPDGALREAPDDYKLVSEGGELYATVTSGYNVVQNRDVLMQAADAIRDVDPDMNVAGNVTQEGGRFRATLMAGKTGTTIQLLKGQERPFLAGFSLENSYLADNSLRAEACAIDLVCTNYNLWGEVVEKFEATHRKTGDLVKGVKTVMNGWERTMNEVAGRFGDAHEVKLRTPQVAFAAAGVGFTPAQADEMQRLHKALEPKSKDDLSLGTLNLAATAYVTHAANVNLTNVRDLSRKAARLIAKDTVDKHEDVLERGKEIVNAWEKERAKAREDRDAKKAAGARTVA